MVTQGPPIPADPGPHAVSRLWAFFVLGILMTTLIFVVTSWRGLEQATRHRLAIMAAAIGRMEQANLDHTARAMRRLDHLLKHTSGPQRGRILRLYLADHPRDTSVAIIGAHGHIVVAAGPLAVASPALTPAITHIIAACPPGHRLCFSPPLAAPSARQTLFARPLTAHTTLILERPLFTWPQLRALIQKLPPRFHVFIVNHNGTLEYRLPRPAHTGYPGPRHGALMRAMKKAALNGGTFSGQTQTGWRFGAYESAHYGLVAGVSLPLKNVIETFVRRLEIPLGLICALLVSATVYYRSSRREIARTEAVQALADARIREERLFAEQQRDFYLAVSELNQFIVRHPDPDRLFAETCRIIIAYTGLLFAWIGRVEPSGDIRIVAWSEKHPLGIDWAHCTFSTDPNRPEGLGTAGRAARSGHIEITDDLAQDGRFIPWRAMREQAGTQSAAALPIRTKGGTVAILALGSERLNLFAPPLVRLLEGLAQDLAFSLEDGEREQQLLFQARHDALTGLDNRALFRQRLEEALAQPAALRRGLAVAILDLDGFKGINDQFGHIVGDELLRHIAARIRVAVPPATAVARLGGDEFGLILSPIDERGRAIPIIEAIRATFDNPFVAAGHEQLAIAASIGISIFPDDGDQVDDLIRRADLALYEAKRLGKNVYRFFSPALEERLLNQHRLQREFITALRESVPVLYFQPQVEIVTGRLRSLEALLRWPRPDGRVWVPGEYFPVIEQDADLMRRLDLYVLHQAAAAIRQLAGEGIRVPIAVNIHGHHLLHPNFLKDIRTILKENPDIERGLELEITETCQVSDLTAAGETLRECRALGIAIALDDFGTGYASLNYLQKLPCDILKIDKSFVSDMSEDPRDFAIVSGILTAARVLHLTTVAEGIEQAEQGLLLRDLGCEYGQGYAISRPIPLEAIARWLHDWRAPGAWIGGRRPATTDALPWLARAHHKKQLKAVMEALRFARAPIPETALALDVCPLHKALQSWMGAPLATLHARVHHIMAEAMREHAEGSPARVTVLTQLQSAEEELDTLLLEALAAPDRRAIRP